MQLDLGPECQEDSDWIRVASKESKNENIIDLLLIDTNFELKKVHIKRMPLLYLPIF